MATARLARAAPVAFDSGNARSLNPGEEVELDSRNFSRITIDGSSGFIETAALEPVPPSVDAPLLPQRSIELRKITLPNFVGEPVTCDRAFVDLLQFVDACAAEQRIKVHVTSSFRRRDAVVSGAIVPPAKRSNHLVGHAIDMNVVLEGTLFNGMRLARENHETLPRAIVDFLNQIRSHSILRWGGDFVNADPVHIDDDLARRNPELWNRKFADLPL